MAMNPRSHQWFLDSVAAGMDKMVAHYGTEVIVSWETFWKCPISDDNLMAMREFGLKYPQAAMHRWGLLAGPRPWVPQKTEEGSLRKDPRYSPHDSHFKS
jgi:hypothetical protein